MRVLHDGQTAEHLPSAGRASPALEQPLPQRLSALRLPHQEGSLSHKVHTNALNQFSYKSSLCPFQKE